MNKFVWIWVGLSLWYHPLSVAGSIVKIVDLPAEMIQLNFLIQEMCHLKYGENYLRPSYPPRFTLLMVDYTNDLKYVFSEKSQSYLSSDDAVYSLDGIIQSVLRNISTPIQMNEQLAAGDLNYFQVTQMPTQQRLEFGAPPQGLFSVLTFEAKPVPELTHFVTQVRTQLQSHELALHQPDGRVMPAYSPFRLVFTSCLIDRVLDDAERLTLAQLAEESGEEFVKKLAEVQFQLRQTPYRAGKILLEVPGQAQLAREFSHP